MKTFFKWLEQTDQEDSVKISIKAALGTMVLGKEDADWLGINTSDLSHSIQDAIINLGELKGSTNPEKALAIKNAVKDGIVIKDLINLVAKPVKKHVMPVPVLGGEDFI